MAILGTVTDKTSEPKVELTADALLAMIAELKKPYVDPNIEARIAQRKQQLHDSFVRMQEMIQARQDACAHLREDNTSAIAWVTNSDRIRRGVCQRCNAVIAPEHPRYLSLLRTPTRGQSIVYV